MTVQAQLKRIDNSGFMARADNGTAYMIDSSDPDMPGDQRLSGYAGKYSSGEELRNRELPG